MTVQSKAGPIWMRMRNRIEIFCNEFLQIAENEDVKQIKTKKIKFASSVIKLETKVLGYIGDLIQSAFIPSERKEFEFRLIVFEDPTLPINLIKPFLKPFVDHNWPMPNELTFPYRVFFDRAQGMIYVYDSIRKNGAIWLDTQRNLDIRSFVAPFRLMFSWMGLNSEAEVIHASAVEIQGSAYFFSGPSGSGKSTLALKLAGHGEIKIISDDAVIIQKGIVHALYSRAKISEIDSFIKIPTKNTMRLQGTDKGKRILPLLNRLDFSQKGVLKAAMFPVIANETSLTKITSTDAVPYLLPNSLREIFQGNARNIINHAQIVATYPCFRFQLGPDYSENVSKFSKVIEELQAN